MRVTYVLSGVNPAGVLWSGPHRLIPLPGSAYWLTRAQCSIKLEIASSRGDLKCKNCRKTISAGHCSDPTGGAYSAPPDTLAGGEGAGCALQEPYSFGPQAAALRASYSQTTLTPPTISTD